ncbi:hypothetical protein SAMN05444170_7170 [Bradyrhizobium erythrophlei]|uniref:Uncharacterized protein n=1 Tax=Bradyrhizobium erythrophlei TaxID=1437360 RepID=A0A1M7UWU5_9BRAD|nr:hypothetical protein SAMN05444170_7170 [Bradyrhizobium erythrophlei]
MSSGARLLVSRTRRGINDATQSRDLWLEINGPRISSATPLARLWTHLWHCAASGERKSRNHRASATQRSAALIAAA